MSLANVFILVNIMSGPLGWNYFSLANAKVLGINYSNESRIGKSYKDYYTWISYKYDTTTHLK